MTIDTAVADAIDAHCRATPGVETGGLIWARGDAIVGCSGPGPRAVLDPRWLEWDAEHIAGRLERLLVDPSNIIGRWHKHVAPILAASDQDRESAEQLRAGLRVDAFPDLIAACGDGDGVAGFALYECREGSYTRTPCDVAVAG